jgi:hypothetical protein
MNEVNELNVETKEVVYREYTAEELLQRNAEINAIIEQDSTSAPVDPIKSSALLKLMSLGLTESEARAIAGA